MLRELAGYLESEGLGVWAQSLFVGDYPDQPADVTVLRHYFASQPEFTHSGSSLETAAVQVMVRRGSYPAAEAAARAVYEALLALRGGHDLGDLKLRHLIPLQSPFYLGQDDARRHRFAFNLDLKI